MYRFFKSFLPFPAAPRKHHTASRRKTLSVESLERREMMAGDVGAYVQNGNLYLNEAAGQAGSAQAVQVSQLANGKIRVQGTQIDGSSSLINGQAFQDFTVTGDLNVNFGGGDDLVIFSESAPPHFKAVNVDVAAPAGYFGSDVDDVIIWGLNTSGGLKINTGAGEDWVYLNNTFVGDGAGVDDVTINTGAASDQVDVVHSQVKGNVSVLTYDNVLEKDEDWVTVDNVGIDKTLAVQLGNGDDHAYVGHLSAKNIGLYGFGGDDDVRVEKVYGVDNFVASMGDGDDTLAIDTLFANRGVIGGGTGYDRLTIKDADTHDAAFADWEMINGKLNLPFPQPFPGAIQIAARAGADYQVAPRASR